ncbi:hypothetical protein ABZP36_015646 [Zizania latifolia]
MTPRTANASQSVLAFAADTRTQEEEEAMAARSDELRVTLLGLALLSLLLLSHTTAPVDAGNDRKNSFSMNARNGGRHMNSFSMNNNEADRRRGSERPGGH